jgi:hypothetical protein
MAVTLVDVREEIAVFRIGRIPEEFMSYSIFTLDNLTLKPLYMLSPTFPYCTATRGRLRSPRLRCTRVDYSDGSRGGHGVMCVWRSGCPGTRV